MYREIFKMINSIVISLLIFGSIFGYKKLTRTKGKFHAPPTHQLPS